MSSELERPGTPGTLRGNGCAADDDEDSDDTAGATIGPNSARAAQMMQQGLAQGKEKKGMKSRFKKAFGMSSSASTSTLTQADVDGRGAKTYPASALRRQDSMDSIDSATTRQSGHMASGSTSTNGASRPPTTTSTRRFGLLNSKLNSSTDNLSISSTVSSASMLIRKLGNVGKVARRNSLMGLTKAFKSKDKESAAAVDDSVVGVSLPSSSGGLGGPKDKSKGSAATADISHVNAEVDRESTAGMSPAAALAKRQQQMYAEQEAAEALARAERQRNGAQQTKPFAAAAAANASRHGRQDSSDAASIKSSRSFGNWGRNKDDAATATKMLQKEKDKLRKSKGRRWGFGSSSVGSAVDSGPAAADDVSAGNVEVLKPPAYATYGSGGLHDEPGHDTGDEYEPSIFQQEARRAARPSKGILKGESSPRSRLCCSTLLIVIVIVIVSQALARTIKMTMLCQNLRFLVSGPARLTRRSSAMLLDRLVALRSSARFRPRLRSTVSCLRRRHLGRTPCRRATRRHRWTDRSCRTASLHRRRFHCRPVLPRPRRLRTRTRA